VKGERGEEVGGCGRGGERKKEVILISHFLGKKIEKRPSIIRFIRNI